MTTTAEIGTATHRGATDYQQGRHVNPYDHATQGDLFRAWIEGYRLARMLAGESGEQR